MPELSDIPIDQVGEYQQAALIRLHLKFTGETHRMLDDLCDQLRKRMLALAGEDGKLAPEFYVALLSYVDAAWHKTITDWQGMFEKARWEAGAIAFGTLGRMHQHYMGLADSVEERRRTHPLPRDAEPNPNPLPQREREFAEAGPGEVQAVFEPQLQAILDAGANRLYSDGFRLSTRIWRLDQDSLNGIRRIVQETLATGDSAWNAAKRVETYLGMGAECPRWTRTRLYKLAKTDIAQGDETGLLRAGGDSPCESKGVAYNALRLARNEIQIAHAMATDAIMSRMPWVEQEQIVLSPAHPEQDICDEVAGGGEKGDGTYPVGTIILPLHVQCLCFKTAVQMAADEFTGKLRGWMTGTEAWPAMDSYALWMGVGKADATNVGLAVSMAKSLTTWLWGDEKALDKALEAGQVAQKAFGDQLAAVS